MANSNWAMVPGSEHKAHYRSYGHQATLIESVCDCLVKDTYTGGLNVPSWTRWTTCETSDAFIYCLVLLVGTLTPDKCKIVKKTEKMQSENV